MSIKRVPEVESLDSHDAEVYLAMSSSPITRKFLDVEFEHRLSDVLPFKGKVLDIGCGGGYITKDIGDSSANLEVTGIDLSVDMVQYAKDNNSAENVQYLQSDAAYLPFGTGEFDVIVSHFFTEHLPTQDKLVQVLNEMARVVKPDGVVFLEDIIRPRSEEELQFLLQQAGYPEEQAQNYADSLRAAFSNDEWLGAIYGSALCAPTCEMPWLSKTESGIVYINTIPMYQNFKKQNVSLPIGGEQ